MLYKKRWFEYFPEKALTTYQKKSMDQEFTSDEYLNFLTIELKPFLFNIMKISHNSNNHFLMGSSMGALISMYGVIEKQDEFGGFAAISTHWPGADLEDKNAFDQSIQDYLNKNFVLSTLDLQPFVNYNFYSNKNYHFSIEDRISIINNSLFKDLKFNKNKIIKRVSKI